MTSTPMFQSIDDALEACEKAGFEPRVQVGGLGEVSYWVYVPYPEDEDGLSAGSRYCAYYGDKQFLGWSNAYFHASSGDSSTDGR